MVRDESKECVRGVTIMRCVIKPPAEVSEHLVVARRQQIELSFSDNTALASSKKHKKSWLMSVKNTAQTSFVSEITDHCMHTT